MTKRLESKYKLDRRMGENIWGRPKSPVNRREYGPGQHGQRRKGKLSDFGVQLKAKQKLRGYYANISEKQFRGIYDEAIRMKGDSGAHMIGLLERRQRGLGEEIGHCGPRRVHSVRHRSRLTARGARSDAAECGPGRPRMQATAV